VLSIGVGPCATLPVPRSLALRSLALRSLHRAPCAASFRQASTGGMEVGRVRDEYA